MAGIQLNPGHACETIDVLYRAEPGRVLATLIRLLGNFDLAEDAICRKRSRRP